ncbi:putative membrane protein [Treponema primitia ZAS-2]|uniref:Putative membrane protein n=1 Tax=Treponema primitia (strain ATCC BAA-887 / DSM 12427 / ZAS-2) TaxID=545694 RepID=F5YNC2_TREPZ|nr:hypothetical protein [Treponema primitia]AEF86560.1 putative membrane protein [Treponema primitia ZAS-2]
MIKITREQISSPAGVFVLYMVISFLVIMGFRFIFPGEPAPLGCFFADWRLSRGILDYIALFPALVMSALVIPFGFKIDMDEAYTRFSPRFLEKLRSAILAAIIATAVYGLLFFIALPLAEESQSNMHFEGELFTMAKSRTELHSAQGEWEEASQFLKVCENIWPQSPEMEQLRIRISIGVETAWSSGIGLGDSRHGTQSTRAANPIMGDQKRAVQDATEALSLSKAALQEKRYYDAHWLATLASQLTKPGSMEAQEAARTASLAWNAVSSLEPSAQENRIYALYRLKRDGYEAMVSEEWIRAYYIFRELAEQTPDDPDVAKFLALSEQGTAGVAFFIDEIEAGIGENLTGAVFSLPLVPTAQTAGGSSRDGTPGGRVVLRTNSLSTFRDYSYAIGVELAAFDGNNRPLYEMEAAYAKFIPMSVRGKPRLVILLRTLDRYNENVRWEPVWTGPGYSDLGDAQIALDTTYEHFLRLSKARRRVDSLNMADLMAMSRDFGNYGYIPQVFQMEIIRRISEPVLLLPLTILSIIIGWRFRAKARPKYLGIPMLAIIPLVLNGVVHLARAISRVLELWLLLSLGFSMAITLFIVVSLIFFILTLIFLASQHG